MHRALFIGRFQPFHNAHLMDIANILKKYDEVIIAIGSSQEKNTEENPFSYNERKKMISETLNANKIKNFRIYPVPDLYNDRKWVEYMAKNLPKFDAVFSGNIWTINCFKKYNHSTKKIRLIKGISSTRIRKMIIKNHDWQRLIPKETCIQIKKIKGAERIQKISGINHFKQIKN